MNTAPDKTAPTQAPPLPAAPPWIPMRSLSPRHRPRILAHLLALSDRDRYLRFGHPAADAQIARYVDSLNFDRDEVFGVFNRRLELVALAHVAFWTDPAAPGEETNTGGAEFGGSVAEHLRGRGYGARLFERAVLHARNRGFDTMHVHALSENSAMLRIARKAGAVVVRSGPESEAHLKLPPDTLASQVEMWVGAGAAAVDYRMKQNARRVDSLIDAIAEVKSGLSRVDQADKG